MTPTLSPATAAGNRAPIAPRPGSAGARLTPPIAPPSPRLSIFQYIAAFYLFLYFSRLIEFLPGLRPLVVFSIILTAGALMSGRFLAMFSTFPGKAMTGLILWCWVCSAFSVWMGGSVKLCFNVTKHVIATLLIVSFCNSFRAAFLLISATALGLGAAALSPSLASGAVAGRVVVGLEDGTLADPNFFALFLLAGLPLLWFVARISPPALKIIPLGLSMVAAYTAVKTGSRGGLVAITVAMLYFLFQATGKQRAKVLLGIGLAAILVVFVAPQSLLVRLSTIVEVDEGRIKSEEELAEAERASGSTSMRLELLKQSLRLTLRNPIFGVGPGMFVIAEADLAETQGRRALWHETHNMYTECSADTGIIGLVLFIATLGGSFRTLGRIRQWCRTTYHPYGMNVYYAAFYLQISLVIVMTAGVFLSILYMSTWWLMAGLSMGFGVAWQNEVAAWQAQEAQRVGRAPALQRT